jgi:outer membrane protein TolC
MSELINPVCRRTSFFPPGCFLSLFVLLFLLNSAVTASASEQTLNLDLSQAVTLAKKNNPLTKISRFEVEAAREKSKEIAGKFNYPQFQLKSYTGLVPGARGTVVSSPDQQGEYNNLGPFFKVDLDIIQPLYTFGKYVSAREAGRFNILVKKAAQQESENQLSFEVVKAFLGVVAGRDGSKVGVKLKEQYHNLLQKIENMLKRNAPDITDSQLLETKSMLFEIEKQSGQGPSAETQATLLLRGLLNLSGNIEINPASPQIPDFNAASTPLGQFLSYVKVHSWQIKGIDAGIKALKQKSTLEKDKKYPDVFLAAELGYGRAPNRDRQTNPFITDDYNYKNIGAVIGMKWDFNYKVHSAEEEQALLDYLKLVEKKKLLVLRLNGEIRNYYQSVQKQWHLLNVADESLRSARQWIRLESDNLDMGIGDVKRLISAYKQYFLLQSEEIQTRHSYLLALADLAKSVGNMELYLQWENDGQVRM